MIRKIIEMFGIKPKQHDDTLRAGQEDTQNPLDRYYATAMRNAMH